MALSEKQNKLDKVKWLKSEVLGYDACGSFAYCCKCDKSLENPCEHALKKFNAAERMRAAREAKKAKTAPPSPAASAATAASVSVQNRKSSALEKERTNNETE